MNSHIQLDRVKSSGDKHIVELGGALKDEITFNFHQGSTLFIDSFPTPIGTGDSASNLRYKNDKDINNQVIENTLTVISEYQKHNQPIVITSYDRNDRIFTFKLNIDGSIHVINKKTNCRDVSIEKPFKEFLNLCNITTEMVLKMRDSTEGSRYNTYLIDVLSFILQMNYFINPDIFEKKSLNTEVVNTLSSDEFSNPILRSFEKNEKLWEPKDGFNYLYFQGSEDSNAYEYMIPKKESIFTIYDQFIQLISGTENDIKKNVREYFLSINLFERFSDYFENDIDDAITLLVIRNAFRVSSLSDEEQSVLDQLNLIIDSWFEELKD